MVDRIANFQFQEIRFLDQTSITIEGCIKKKTLDSTWTPCSWSVICARTKEARTHMGNKRLRILVDSHLEKYIVANRIAKGIIVSAIVDSVRNASDGGGFVKQSKAGGIWAEVGDSIAREKVGQMLREEIAKKDPKKMQQRKEQRKAKASKKRALDRSTSTAGSSSSSDTSVSTAESSSTPSTTTGNSSLGSTSSVQAAMPVLSSSASDSDLELESIDFDPLPLEPVESATFVFDLASFQF